MNEAIKISNLSKSYGTHIVLNGLDFSVQQGEIFALLGVNGAGKTTSLECIEGLRKYDSGNITINGIMGIQLQSASLPKYIKALEAVKLFAKWNKTSLDRATLDALGIYELSKKPYYQLSTGQKRRLHLALALTRNPDILFLDEPTAGLDVEGQISLHEQIRQLKAIGKTIILASHDMAEVENLCDRIAILSGKLPLSGLSGNWAIQSGSIIISQSKRKTGLKTMNRKISEIPYFRCSCSTRKKEKLSQILR